MLFLHFVIHQHLKKILNFSFKFSGLQRTGGLRQKRPNPPYVTYVTLVFKVFFVLSLRKVCEFGRHHCALRLVQMATVEVDGQDE